MPYIRELITALGVQYYELDNCEADDIIGTLAQKVDKEQFDVVVLSGDRDLTQLATDHVKVDITVKGCQRDRKLYARTRCRKNMMV